jgi:hypothetical protein
VAASDGHGGNSSWGSGIFFIPWQEDSVGDAHEDHLCSQRAVDDIVASIRTIQQSSCSRRDFVVPKPALVRRHRIGQSRQGQSSPSHTDRRQHTSRQAAARVRSASFSTPSSLTWIETGPLDEMPSPPEALNQPPIFDSGG